MNQCLHPRARIGRRMTFAHTRPLSPTDLSGITGLLQDEAPGVQAAPKGLQRAFAFLRGLMTR